MNGIAAPDQHQTIFQSLLLMLLSMTLMAACQRVEKVDLSDKTLTTAAGASYMAHEVIVHKPADVSIDELEAALKKLGATLVTEESVIENDLGFYRVQLPAEVTADVAINNLLASGVTDVAERNYVINATTTSGDNPCAIKKVNGGGFTTSITNVVESGDNYNITLEVEHDGCTGTGCAELSHYSVQAEKDSYFDVSHSGVDGEINLGWQLGSDPFNGFKIDNTAGIGDGMAGNFTISYTVSYLQQQGTAAKSGSAFNVAQFSTADFQQVMYCLQQGNLHNPGPDPQLPEQWAIKKIEADKAWEITTGSKNVIVAVSDSGFDVQHEDLAAQLWTNTGEIPNNGIDDDNNGCIDDVNGWNWMDNNKDIQDDRGHGTAVSGVIGAVGNNSIGIAGVNWNVTIMPVKILGASGSGSLWDAAKGLVYAAKNGADVVNASWGCAECKTSYMEDAISVMNDRGVILVAAAGNDGRNTDRIAYYPAGYKLPNVVSVAATDEQDRLSSYSNYGVGSVLVAAPGDNIVTTDIPLTYGVKNGTSLAAPQVSGVLGLYLSVFIDIDISVETVINRLVKTSDPVAGLADKVISGGRINAHRMLTDDDEAPLPPTDLVALPGLENDVTLIWTPSESSDTSMYQCKWGTASGEYDFSIELAPTETQVTIRNLMQDIPHFFVCHARDRAGNVSTPSNEAEATPADLTPPGQVINLEAMPVPGPVASGSVFNASSEASSYYQASHAYDGSYETAWMAVPSQTDGPEYLIVDFNLPVMIDRVQLTPVAMYPEFFPVDFDIEVSNDGTSWTIVGGMRDVVIETADDKVQVAFPPVEAAHLRLNILDSSAHISQLQYTGVAEIEAFKPSENPDAIILTFSAPGDDTGVGHAGSYDIRYSTAPITADNFAQASPIEMLNPAAAGVREQLVIENLAPETAFFFAMVAYDEAGNVSQLSNIAAASTAVVLPGTINDLTATRSQYGDTILSWTAPGDNGYSGRAATYDIRWSVDAINAGNFALATPIANAPAPIDAGSHQELDISDLADGQYIYIAIKAVDQYGHAGGISNVVWVQISDDNDIEAPAAVNDLKAYPSLARVRHYGTVIDSSSHFQTDYLAQNLQDDDVLTMWITEDLPPDLPEWVVVDLEETRPISQFRLHPTVFGSFAIDFPRDFSISVSADNVNWEPIVTVEGQQANAGQWLEFNFENVVARFVKLHISLRGTASCNVPTDCNEPSQVAISEFEINGPTADFDADLVWIAPGDDGYQGQAFAYDLRHDTAPLTESNFLNAEEMALGTPEPGGMFEVRTISHLDWGQTHYFAFRTVDESGNWSGISNVASVGAPVLPPAPVINLTSQDVTTTGATLNWVATGDDGVTGTATSYDMRYSLAPITRDNWHSADVLLNTPIPAVAGTPQAYVVSGLSPNTDYFFAMKVWDDEGAVSVMSNVMHLRTMNDIPPTTVTDLKALRADNSNGLPVGLTLVDTSSAYTATAGAAMAIDEDETTAWLTGRNDEMTPEFIELAFDGPVTVSDINILPAPGYADMFPVSFAVQLRASSDDPWITVINEDYFYVNTDENWEEWSIGAVDATALRIELRQTQPSSFGYFAAIGEIEVIEAVTAYDVLNLYWTAPHTEDGMDGADSYDIRTSDTAIDTQKKFRAASMLSSIPVPQNAGMPESLRVDDLTPETEYCFALQAFDTAHMAGNISNSACAYTPGVAPATIVDLQVESATTSTATLHWTAPGADGNAGQADSYDIRMYKQRINKTTWEEALIAANTPSPAVTGTPETFVVDGLEGDARYFFTVRAIDAAGNMGGISNNATGITGDNVPPLPIDDLVLTTDFDNSGTLMLNWTAPGDSGAVGQAAAYDIRYDLAPITSLNFEAARVVPISVPTPATAGSAEALTVTGLPLEEMIYVAIKAKDGDGNYSTISNVPAARTKDELPSRVENLAVVETSSYELGNANALLEWTAPGDNGIDGISVRYEFRYALDSLNPEGFESATLATIDLVPAPGLTVQQVIIDGLTEGTNYCFAMVAIDDRDNVSPVSNVACEETADGVPPATIFDLVATTGGKRGEVDLTWTHPGDDLMEGGNVSSYDLRWSYSEITADNFAAATKPTIQPNPANAGTRADHTVIDLPDETLLHFAIKAIDNSGNKSSTSNDAPARTPDVPPAAIDDLEQTGMDMTTISLGWTAPGDDEWLGTAVAYDLRYSLSPINNDNFDAATPYSIAPPQPGLTPDATTIANLVDGTTYYIAIKTVDDRGNWSPISNFLIANTLDTVPPGQIDPLVPSTGTEPGAIKLEWDATGDDGDVGTATTYQIRRSAECITEANWDAATAIDNSITPRPAGSPELFNVKGLEAETLYFFAIRALDEVGNVGLISPCASAETAPVGPDKITDLAGEAIRPRSVVLTWTAPADTGVLGKAVEYDLRYATWPITKSNFLSAQRFTDAPLPAAPGTPETTTVPGLTESTLYYFAIKSVDDRGAWSVMSNVAEVMTLDETAPAAPGSMNAATPYCSSNKMTPAGVTVSTQLVDILGAENTIDDDADTMWVSDASSIQTEEWIEFDLGDIYSMERVRLMPNPDYIHLFPGNFKIQVSIDGSTWTDVRTEENFIAPTDTWMTFGFAPSAGQYVRVTSYDPITSYFGLYYTVIADMEVYSACSTYGSVALSWTAPGDDVNVGTVTYYDIYYQETPFDGDNIDTAGHVRWMTTEERPLVASGEQEGIAIGGLKGETRYYFDVRAEDEATNVGPFGQVTTAISKDARPGRVSTLAASSVGMYDATLNWVSTGDDGLMGTADHFELRYAAYSLTEENFPFASAATVPAPQIAGTSQSASVSDLLADTKYTFAIVVFDEKGAASYLSNTIVIHTTPEPDAIAPTAIGDLDAHLISDSGSLIAGTAIDWTTAQDPGYSAQYMMDGDDTSSWASVGKQVQSDESVTIDLGNVYPVGEMNLLPDIDFADLFPPGIEIRVSMDNLSWTSVYSADNIVATPGAPLHAIFPVSAVRYIEVIATELSVNDNSYYYAVIGELEVIHANLSPGTIVTTWTATGDDLDAGTAGEYQLLYSPCPFNAATATEVATQAPNTVGKTEVYRITDLPAGTYCIAVNTLDEAGNQSGLSNTVEVTTPGM